MEINHFLALRRIMTALSLAVWIFLASPWIGAIFGDTWVAKS
jgi:hypothetical protein